MKKGKQTIPFEMGGRERRRASTTPCAVTVDNCRNWTWNDVDGDRQRQDVLGTATARSVGIARVLHHVNTKR